MRKIISRLELVGPSKVEGRIPRRVAELLIWALAAERNFYIYRGFSKERISARMDPLVGALGLEIDCTGDWVDPSHYPEVRLEMLHLLGPERFREMWRRPALERFCFVCGHDLTAAMGCTTFIFNKPRSQKASVGFETIPGDPLICTGCYRDRGGNTFGDLEYRRLVS